MGEEGDANAGRDREAQEVQDHNIFEKGDVDTSIVYPGPVVLPMTPKSNSPIDEGQRVRARRTVEPTTDRLVPSQGEDDTSPLIDNMQNLRND